MENTGGNQQFKRFTPPEGEVWTCSVCGTNIEWLSFVPRKGSDGKLLPLYCYQCYKNRQSR